MDETARKKMWAEYAKTRRPDKIGRASCRERV